MKLVVQQAHGHPAIALTGESIVVRGVVEPYVPHQKVTVSFYFDGRAVQTRKVGVQSLDNGAGQFHVAYAATRGGVANARATHTATAQESAFGASSVNVRFVDATMGEGAHGPGVGVLQSELNALHYAVPLNGDFEEATGRAVVALRKVAGLARVPSTNASVFHLLEHGGGEFHVRYPRDGRHVEADLSKQVLAEIEPGGRVRRIYTMSSGKPSTPTVIGHFQVYSKTPGTNAKGMVDANYFIRGYAIHGYAEVPAYAASHGCLRVPIPDAPAIFGWVQLGTPVDVYFESGGGSHSVRGNAGP
jgi:L,D-transpeptidase catalytic domain